ncbi:MAG: DUF72 domain-containing protein [Candidatus Nezhaarchaeota archaeon]|nr:DUF72 domain-containing protein [Candidatus Nezhaarchaeota archaeon]
MELFVGTSGWQYDWNPNGFEWFAKNSGLNAVELNASFYRYPFKSQVEGWRRRSPPYLRWSIKVHRLITHVYKLAGKAYDRCASFLEAFKPLDGQVDFYLFQLPPSIRPTSSFLDRLEAFAREVGLGPRMALEWRHLEWFHPRWAEWCSRRGITVVSVDSPEATCAIYPSAEGLVYLRMHGRSAWYVHEYSLEELEEVVDRLSEAGASRAYVFFNNDHDMLHNAHELLEIARMRKILTPGLASLSSP